MPKPSPPYLVHAQLTRPAGGGSTVEHSLPWRLTGFPSLFTGVIGTVFFVDVPLTLPAMSQIAQSMFKALVFQCI